MKNKSRTVVSEIEINAPRQKVWEVLTDFERMHEWSTSFQKLEGEFKDGGKAISYYKTPLGNVISFEHTLIEFEEGVSFGWSDPVALGMRDHHIFLLEDLPNGNTKFTQTDSVQGGASWLLHKLMEHNMKSMYDQFNKELKARVESMIA